MGLTKKNLVSITVERKTRTSDGAGGYTTSDKAITGSPFAGRKIRIRKPVLVDGIPSDVEVDTIVLAFNAGTDIKIEDICTVNSKCYIVRGVRNYTRSLQADVERQE